MDLNFPGSTLRDYIRVIFRRRAVIITTFVTVIISAIIGLELMTPMYDARVKMLITAEKQAQAPYYTRLGYGRGGGLSTTQSEIVTSNPVIERAVKVLKLYERPSDYEKNFCSPLKAWLIDLRHKMKEMQKVAKNNLKTVPLLSGQETTLSLIGNTEEKLSVEEAEDVQKQMDSFRGAVGSLKGKITVEPIENTDLFTIAVSDFSPVEAATIANVVSRSYVIFDLEQQLAEYQLKYGEKHPIVVQLENGINKITKNLTGETLPAMEAIGPASVKIIEQAQAPSKPTGKSKTLILLLAIAMSLFLGVILAFGFEFIDQTFKSPQDVETFLNLPLLGSIPKKGFKNGVLIKDSKRTASLIQPYQNLSDQLYLLMKDKNLKSILITAASPIDGSTTIIANIANFLSNKAGHKVMVIDANLRMPSTHKVFNISDNGGLANVLEGKISLEKAAQVLGTNLTVLPAGNTSLNPTPLLDSTNMFNVMKTAKEKYEFIFVDYANLRSFKDACVLCPHLDGIVLVVNEGKTRHHTIKTLIAPLKHKKANLIGVILKNRTYAIPKMIYERL
ncbi:MAG: polysaccharide biosynthesis tyrosine autokinase [Candidatus Brocadia sp.]|nr:polysaccharide biosynthesis tyrosine autokinase [Candidatus Brocadia sp.]